MNYYERYIGDIQRDTGHLSCAEMGAYDRLLDHYYATEAPLPDDLDTLCRIARAMTPAERKAVASVVKQFFSREEDGCLHQGKADKVVASAQVRIGAAKENGKKGGRPRKHNPEVTQQKPTGFSAGNPAGTQDESSPTPTPNYSVDRSGVTPNDSGSARVMPTPEGVLAVALRKLGVDVTSMHPVVLEWAKAGVTVAQATQAVHIARQSKPEPQRIPAKYLDAVIRNEILKPTGGLHDCEARVLVVGGGRRLNAVERVQQALAAERGQLFEHGVD